MYKKTTISEPIIAKKELFFISSAIVGPTFIDDIIPIVFTSDPLINSSMVKSFGKKLNKDEKSFLLSLIPIIFEIRK